MEENKPKLPKYKLVTRYAKLVDPAMRDPLIRGYIEILATILLVAFFVFFAIRPTLNTVSELLKKSSELKTTDVALTQKIKNLVAAQAVYSHYENQIPLLETAMPKKPETVPIIFEIEKLVNKNQVELTSLAISNIGLTADLWKKDETLETVKKIPLVFTITIKGSFNNGEQFVADLVSLKRFLNVDKVTYDSPKNTNDLSINIQGTGYFLP